jgi:diadenosine tetraphosphate (Ap4A) HIT family hydrolase
MPAYDPNNVFARILRGESPCERVYEDEFALAFKCIPARTPVHILVVPKGAFISNADFSASASARQITGFWRAVGSVARQLGLERDGYRLVANHGVNGNQTVDHFHVHILGGRLLPPVARQS